MLGGAGFWAVEAWWERGESGGWVEAHGFAGGEGVGEEGDYRSVGGAGGDNGVVSEQFGVGQGSDGAVEVGEEGGDVEAHEGGGRIAEFEGGRTMESEGAAGVAAAEMFKGDGGLDEAVVERFLGAGRQGAPDFFPDFVGEEVALGVEEGDAVMEETFFEGEGQGSEGMWHGGRIAGGRWKLKAEKLKVKRGKGRPGGSQEWKSQELRGGRGQGIAVEAVSGFVSGIGRVGGRGSIAGCWCGRR